MSMEHTRDPRNEDQANPDTCCFIKEEQQRNKKKRISSINGTGTNECPQGNRNADIESNAHQIEKSVPIAENQFHYRIRLGSS